MIARLLHALCALWSPDHCSIEFTGRAGIIYREGARTMFIDSELLAGPDADIVVWVRNIERWEKPHDQDRITASDSARIRSNLEKQLRRYKVVWD